MDQHLTGFSLIGAVVLVAVSIGGGILAVTSSSFSNNQPQHPTATSSFYPTSSNQLKSTSSTSNKENQPEKQSQTITIDGVIQSLDASEMPVDGPMRITIKKDSEQLQVAVPSRESSICQTEGQITDLFSLSEGDMISVQGKVNKSGSIVPCESSSHYLRKDTQQANAPTSTIFLRFSKSNAVDEPVEGNTLRTWYEISFAGEYKLYEEIYRSGSGNQRETDTNLVATGTIAQSKLQELRNLLVSANFYEYPNRVPQFSSDERPLFEGPAGTVKIEARSDSGSNLHAVSHNEGARGGTYPNGFSKTKQHLSQFKNELFSRKAN